MGKQHVCLAAALMAATLLVACQKQPDTAPTSITTPSATQRTQEEAEVDIGFFDEEIPSTPTTSAPPEQIPAATDSTSASTPLEPTVEVIPDSTFQPTTPSTEATEPPTEVPSEPTGNTANSPEPGADGYYNQIIKP